MIVRWSWNRVPHNRCRLQILEPSILRRRSRKVLVTLVHGWRQVCRSEGPRDVPDSANVHSRWTVIRCSSSVGWPWLDVTAAVCPRTDHCNGSPCGEDERGPSERLPRPSQHRGERLGARTYRENVIRREARNFPCRSNQN